MPTASPASISPSGALDRLAEGLDLSNIRLKLADPHEGKGLSEPELDRRESEYRKFLALHLAYPHAQIVPCQLVDEVWHQHILDTRAYHDDCDSIFGGYLHHFPYFGMRDEADSEALNEAYADTIARYRKAFGEPPTDTWISTEPSKCKRTACKPQHCK